MDDAILFAGLKKPEWEAVITALMYASDQSSCKDDLYGEIAEAITKQTGVEEKRR